MLVYRGYFWSSFDVISVLYNGTNNKTVHVPSTVAKELSRSRAERNGYKRVTTSTERRSSSRALYITDLTVLSTRSISHPRYVVSVGRSVFHLAASRVSLHTEPACPYLLPLSLIVVDVLSRVASSVCSSLEVCPKHGLYMCRWSIFGVRVRRDNSEQPFRFQQWNRG